MGTVCFPSDNGRFAATRSLGLKPIVIVRPRPHWIRLLLVRRGSLVHRIYGQQLFILGLSCAVVLAHGQLFLWKVPLTAGPFSLMGISFAIFLGFRINASYDRFWEARKHWGSVLVEARNLARQALTAIAPGRDVRPGVWVGLNGSIPWDQVSITGPVYIGSSVRLEPGCTVVGPAWIDHGCVIKTGATVTRSVLFEYTRIAAGMHFIDSIVSRQYCVDRHGDTVYRGDDATPLRWGDARV